MKTFKGTNHIKELRYRLGMTQEQFAVQLGVTHDTISRWESNKHYSLPLALEKFITDYHTTQPLIILGS